MNREKNLKEERKEASDRTLHKTLCMRQVAKKKNRDGSGRKV